jgi:DNA-binding NarL/FixJ family response regulator
VGVIASGNVLAVGVVAALAIMGWSCRPVDSLAAFDDLAAPVAVVVMADADGAFPDVPARAGSTTRPVAVEDPARRPLVIAVGDRAALCALAAGVHRSPFSAVLDGDAPFTALLAELDGLLSGRRDPPPPASVVAATRRRGAESARCRKLSRREAAVLGSLLAGSSAAEICSAEHVSMPTVRTQIRGVLTKLEAPSQLAAVALASRAWIDQPRIVILC